MSALAHLGLSSCEGRGQDGRLAGEVLVVVPSSRYHYLTPAHSVKAPPGRNAIDTENDGLVGTALGPIT